MKENTSNVGIVCGAGIFSGKEAIALELSKGFRKKGYAVEILTSFWGNGEFHRRSRAAELPTQCHAIGIHLGNFDFRMRANDGAPANFLAGITD